MNSFKLRTIEINGNNVRFLIISVFLAILVFSCEPIDNPDTNDARDKLLGTWSCRETETSSQSQITESFEVDISKSSTDSTKIFIDNFNGLQSGSVYAKMDGLNLTITSQLLDNYQFSGSGTISSKYDKINLSYTRKIGTEITTYTAVYSNRQ